MNNFVSNTLPADLFCADLSREAGEPMAGTAPAADVWFLLEYAGPWTAKATIDNDLPPAIQTWLTNALAHSNRSHLQFIKQKQTSPAVGVTLFVALAREVMPLLYEFRLNTYDDLHSLDLARLLAGAAYEDHRRSEPLYLVCTNGRRDRCCSRLGLSLYRALDAQVGDAAWQTTHLGGHRFAPTLVTLPDGACYGRLAASDVMPLVQAQATGELYLSHLRGRCCYEDVVQAADYFLRQDTGTREIDAYRLLDARPTDAEQWTVRFVTPATGAVQRLVVSRVLSKSARLVSCNPAKSKPVLQFRLISLDSAT